MYLDFLSHSLWNQSEPKNCEGEQHGPSLTQAGPEPPTSIFSHRDHLLFLLLRVPQLNGHGHITYVYPYSIYVFMCI